MDLLAALLHICAFTGIIPDTVRRLEGHVTEHAHTRQEEWACQSTWELSLFTLSQIMLSKYRDSLPGKRGQSTKGAVMLGPDPYTHSCIYNTAPMQQNDTDTAFFYLCISLPCQSLAPTSPTMQLKHQQFGQRVWCVFFQPWAARLKQRLGEGYRSLASFASNVAASNYQPQLTESGDVIWGDLSDILWLLSALTTANTPESWTFWYDSLPQSHAAFKWGRVYHVHEKSPYERSSCDFHNC